MNFSKFLEVVEEDVFNKIIYDNLLTKELCSWSREKFTYKRNSQLINNLRLVCKVLNKKLLHLMKMQVNLELNRKDQFNVTEADTAEKIKFIDGLDAINRICFRRIESQYANLVIENPIPVMFYYIDNCNIDNLPVMKKPEFICFIYCKNVRIVRKPENMIKYLIFHRCTIQEIDEDIVNLEIHQSKIYNLDSIKTCSNITTLDLNSTNLIDFDLRAFINLEKVNIWTTKRLCNIWVNNNPELLVHSYSIHSIFKLEAPELESIVFDGKFVEIDTLNTPKLQDIKIKCMYLKFDKIDFRNFDLQSFKITGMIMWSPEIFLHNVEQVSVGKYLEITAQCLYYKNTKYYTQYFKKHTSFKIPSVINIRNCSNVIAQCYINANYILRTESTETQIISDEKSEM